MFGWFRKKQASGSGVPEPLGVYGEQYAESLYVKDGYRVVARREFNRKGKQVGETDLIVTKGSDIVFVEVKTRDSAGSKFGSAEESVGPQKQARLLRAAKSFLARNPKFQSFQPRIDVCALEVNDVDRAVVRAKILMNAVEDTP